MPEEPPNDGRGLVAPPADGWEGVAVTADATGSLRAEVARDLEEPGLPAEARTHHDVIRAFQTVAGALGETRDLDPLLTQIADQVCLLLGATRCSIHLRDAKAGVYRGRAANSGQDIDVRVRRLVLGMPSDRFTHEIVKTRKPVVLIDAMADPRAIRSSMRAWEVQSVLGVPMLLRDEVIGLMIIDDEGRRNEFPSPAQELALAFAGLAATAIDQAQLNAKLRSTLGTVARQNRLLRRASALEESLSALLIDGSGLQQTAELVSRATGKPCAISTADLQPVAVTNGEGGKLLIDLLHHGGGVASSLILEAAAIGDEGSAVVGPFAAINVHHRFLVAPVRRRDALWGYVIVAEHRTRLNALDHVVARRAALNIAIELSVQDRDEFDRAEAYGALVAALVRGDQSTSLLQHQAERLAVPLDVERVVVVVASHEPGLAALAAAQVPAWFDDLPDRPRAVGTSDRERAVLLVETGGEGAAAVAERVRLALAELVDDADGLIAAVSRPYASAAATVAAHAEAVETAECARRHVPPGGGVVLSAEEIGVGRILLASKSAEEADRFVLETLGPLACGRSVKEDDVLVTLTAFLASRSVSLVAKELRVHENTVRYRLSRVEDATGMNLLTDHEAQMAAHFAVLVLRLRGEMPALSPVGSQIVPRQVNPVNRRRSEPRA
ncbi:MAG: putative CdaR family transcriptional regulator [Solirubrobacterales bacterium]|nr:putative CdaR family transcriptional regulator [Solirubrobacterales bacterium]